MFYMDCESLTDKKVYSGLCFEQTNAWVTGWLFIVLGLFYSLAEIITASTSFEDGVQIGAPQMVWVFHVRNEHN